MNTRNIYAVIALVLGIPIAIFLGISAAQNQVDTVLWIGGVGFLIMCVLLGRHIWILIPATIGMKGVINALPGTPAPWHLITLVVLAFTLIRLATRQQRIRFRWTGMETVVLLVALTILQAFVRNPTGLSILGGELAGGKPYFVFGVAIVAFVLIGTADADMKSWKWGVIAYIVITLADGLVASASAVFPDLAMAMIRFYSNVNLDAIMVTGYAADLETQRFSQWAQIGAMLGLMATTLWRPVASLDLRKPWRIVAAMLALLTSLLSGFRGKVVLLGSYFILGSLIRKKPMDVAIVGFLGSVVLAGIVGSGLVPELPYGAQRAMSFIPGIGVRSDVLRSAEGSAELRFEMWREVAFTDRYISNKLLGDGFQTSAAEHAAQRAWMLGDHRIRRAMSKLDMHLAGGSYHGFHVETIRFTGIVGLIAATVALIVFAVYAWRLIQHYRGHPDWGFVLLICMPALINPLWYWLVFGAYRSGFPNVILMAGLIKLLDMIRHAKNSPLEAPVAEQQEALRAPATPESQATHA